MARPLATRSLPSPLFLVLQCMVFILTYSFGVQVPCAVMWKLLSSILLILASSVQNVKAYLRRGTAREMLGYYKDAIDGESVRCSLNGEVVFCYAFVILYGSLGTNNYGRNTLSKKKMLNTGLQIIGKLSTLTTIITEQMLDEIGVEVNHQQTMPDLTSHSSWTTIS